MAVSNNSDDKMNLDMVKGALLFGVPNLGMDNQEIIGLLQEDDLPAVYTASLLDERSGFRQRMKQADDFHDACSKKDAVMYAFYETEKTSRVCRVWSSIFNICGLAEFSRIRKHSVGFGMDLQRFWSVRVPRRMVVLNIKTRYRGKAITTTC